MPIYVYTIFGMYQGSDNKKSNSSSQDGDRWLCVDGCIVERQRRITPFHEWSPRSLFLTDPPHLMWSDGRPMPVEDVVGDHDWEPLIEVMIFMLPRSARLCWFKTVLSELPAFETARPTTFIYFALLPLAISYASERRGVGQEGTTDEDGWRYGFNWNFQARPRPPPSHFLFARMEGERRMEWGEARRRRGMGGGWGRAQQKNTPHACWGGICLRC